MPGSDRRDPRRTDSLHTERRRGRGVEHRAAERERRELGQPGEVTDEAAGERVARARRIDDVFEGDARSGEDAVIVEEERAVLAPLDDQAPRPTLEDRA